MISKESDKKIREMLCVHQTFRRVPKLVFEDADTRLWVRQQEVVKALLDDEDLNMDFQWKQTLDVLKPQEGGMVMIDSSALDGSSRPENPRIAEAYNMVSLRPSVFDMEHDTDIFRNAMKEHPLLPARDALYQACKEIYVAIDRDLYLFISEVDNHYGTDYVKNSMDYIIQTKREDPAYRKAEAYLGAVEAKGFSSVRQEILNKELTGYEAVIAANRYLPAAPPKDSAENVSRLDAYKGMDVSWAHGRLPSKDVVKSYFAQGLYPLLEEAAGRAFIKNDPLRRYEAMLDRAERALPKEREKMLLFHAPEILYGAGYVKIKEWEAARRVAPKETETRQDSLAEGR